MASGSGSDAAEPAEPAAAPAAAEAEEETDNPVKRRRLQCMGFALVAKCDPTMAHTFLSENDWQMDVGLRGRSVPPILKALSAFFEPPENDPAWPRQPPTTFRSEAYVDLTNEDANDTTTLESRPSGPPLEDSSIITFITWNIDGLDGSNLPERARAVTKCGGLPDNVFDAWEFLGKPKHCQYTWDTRVNTNLRIPAACKHRFDRIFFRAEKGHLIPQSLDLVGLEKLDCGRFPSDHWGLLCTLN
ncbi:hypothetical protein A6R68_16501, partial [Neotoma lepida]